MIIVRWIRQQRKTIFRYLYWSNIGLVGGTRILCFFGDYSRYYKILIALEDQATRTFICPWRIYDFQRMPFELCNALAVFQQCMMSIFENMVEQGLETFIDDFLGIWFYFWWVHTLQLWLEFWRGAKNHNFPLIGKKFTSWRIPVLHWGIAFRSTGFQWIRRKYLW